MAYSTDDIRHLDAVVGGPLKLQTSGSPVMSPIVKRKSSQAGPGAISGIARHTFGLILLLCVVFLWTTSNFLGSSIFADNSYAKPFFLTYLNTTCFMLALVPVFIRKAYRRLRLGSLLSSFRKFRGPSDESQPFLKPDHPLTHTSTSTSNASERTYLGLRPTTRLSFTFCILWFSANYFAMACLQHTTVASTTILTSTSSIWTLLIGAFTRTEKFTLRKLLGVLASFIGILLVTSKDLTSNYPAASPNPPTARSLPLTRPFPSKRASELFLGDTLAFLSAIIYGLYTITLKRSTLSAAPLALNMPLFFGLVGFFNFLLLAPLFPILHYTGIEPFALPPSRRIWTILLFNAAASLLSDIAWAYAMLFTSPLVVTVGLSLTIPLSLVGEVVLQGRSEGLVYWIGAGVVVGSFVFVDREAATEDVDGSEAGGGENGAGEAAGEILPGVEDFEDRRLTDAATTSR